MKTLIKLIIIILGTTGALYAQNLSSGNSATSGSVFRAAHKAATPQSWQVIEQWYDAAGNEIKTIQGTVKMIFSVQQGNKARKTIMTYP